MDKQGNIPISGKEAFLGSFREDDLETDTAETPRKVSLSEYLASPEFQRARQVEAERAQRAEYERKMRFRSAQAQNPIKGRPRRKRRRKAR